MNMTLVYSIILDMTLLYLLMFLIILFLVYFDYMIGIVLLSVWREHIFGTLRIRLCKLRNQVLRSENDL
jgi:hypothetical protein